MHICVSKLTIIGSDNGSSLGWCQTIIWTNAGILLNGPLGTNFNEILKEIPTFSLKKIHLKMSSAKCCPFRIGLRMLNHPWYWGWHVLGLVLLQWPLHDLLDLWHQRQRWNNLGFTTPETGHWGCYGSLLQSLYSDDLDHATSQINSVTDLVIPGTRGLEKCGLNVWRMMSVNLPCLVFDTMGRMVVVGGWVDGGWWCYRTLLIISQHWLRYWPWVGAVWQQVIAQAQGVWK